MKYQYDNRHLKFGNAGSVQDPNTMALLKNINVDLVAALTDDELHNRFLNQYRTWILSSTNNRIYGIENFKHQAFSNGTTEAFDKFYMKNRQRRFRCFKGEYMYHKLVWRNHWPDWKHIEDEALQSNDAVVVSLPFSDTGNKHVELDRLLSECDRLEIPVLLDCAYFGACEDITIDLRHECITDVTFSLSKTFPVAYNRIGMRLTRVNDDDPLFVVNYSGYLNRSSAAIGLEFMAKFSPDYIFEKYRIKQLEFCRILNVEPSQTVMFGIGREGWEEYNRGRSTNRLSFHRQLHMTTKDFIQQYVER